MTDTQMDDPGSGAGGERSRFSLSLINRILLGVAIILQVVLLVVFIGRFSSELVIQLVKNVATVVIIPLVLSYLAWIMSRENKSVGGAVFALALAATTSWVVVKDHADTKSFRLIYDFSQQQRELTSQYQSAGSEEEKSAALESMHDLKMELLDSLGSKSGGAVREFYSQLRTNLVALPGLQDRFSELQDVVFAEDFIDYARMKDPAVYESKRKLAQELSAVSADLSQLPSRIDKAVKDLTASSEKIGRLEAEIIERELKASVQPAGQMKTFYLTCQHFGGVLNQLLEWLYSHRASWVYDAGSQSISVDTPKDREEFSALVAAAEAAAAQLNAAASKVNSTSILPAGE